MPFLRKVVAQLPGFFLVPPVCMLLRKSITSRHNDDKSILNPFSHFIIRTPPDCGKSDYHYPPFTKEKTQSRALRDWTEVTQPRSGRAAESHQCRVLTPVTVPGRHPQKASTERHQQPHHDSPQEVRFWDLPTSPSLPCRLQGQAGQAGLGRATGRGLEDRKGSPR